jgi:hypothetical protein
MTKVFKESDYYSDSQQENHFPQENPFPVWENHIFNGVQGLRSDFGEVIAASKKFPIRSTLTIIGFFTVMYIAFRMSRSFVKIKNRLRG